MAVIHVEAPGFLSTIQDTGRFGWAHLGISASGAADALALRIGNLLAGNDEQAAAIEMTLAGGAFTLDADAVVALTGSDFEPRVGGRAVRLWKAIAVRAGERVELGRSRSGARCYLCVGGGIEVPRVLGSASTHLLSGLGGHQGRSLRAGDRLAVAPARPLRQPAAGLDAAALETLYAAGPLRITVGPQADLFGPEMTARLVASDYTVREASDRMGIRLAGPPLGRRVREDLLTEGVSLGAIQIPEDGQPIILFVEHQTTGGYPKIANVCLADMHRVGQLRPRDTVRFQAVKFADAARLLRDREALVERLRSHPTP